MWSSASLEWSNRNTLDTRIILLASWIALMLTYLLGDVLRIFSGDYQAGEMGKQLANFSQPMWLGIAILMVTPIVMVILSLILPQPVNRWTNIIGLGFNILTVWYAWNWV